jgi:biopolymer transport protein ExbD
MKLAVTALVLVAGCGACKDKQAPANRDEPAPESVRQRPGPRPDLETPAVTGPGLVPATGLGPKITFSKTEIKIDDETIAPIRQDGWIDPTRVQALIRVLEGKATSDAPVAITLDASVPYRRVGQLLDTLKRAGFRNLALLTGNGGQMIPIELPDAAEINGAGLRPVVTLERNQVKLWSASGHEGTRARPKLSFALGDRASFEPLTRALAEIVQRRWPDHKRGDEDRAIIIQPDGNQPAQTLLSLLAAVRVDGSLELFPNIFLAGGR